MLIAMAAKNAILIVEFAKIKFDEGLSLFDAAVEAAILRFRPILMTSFAFIAGLLPLVFSHGAGAIGNKTIGGSALGGMLFGTLFGVVIVPASAILFIHVSIMDITYPALSIRSDIDFHFTFLTFDHGVDQHAQNHQKHSMWCGPSQYM